MKIFVLSSGVISPRRKALELSSGLVKGGASSFSTTFIQDTGSLSSFDMKSYMIKNDRSFTLVSSVQKGKVGSFVHSGFMSLSEDEVDFVLSSKIRTGGYKSFELKSSTKKLFPSSFELKSSVDTRGASVFSMKSMFPKRGFTQVIMSSSVTKMERGKTLSFSLLSSVRKYASPIGPSSRDFESVLSPTFNITYEDVSSESMFFYLAKVSNVAGEEIGGYESRSVPIKVEADIEVISSFYYTCRLTHPEVVSLDGVSSSKQRFTGILGSLSVFESNIIPFSINRETIDFGQTSATALKFFLLPSDHRFDKLSPNIHIDFSKNLKLIGGYIFNGIISVNIEKRVAESKFGIQDSAIPIFMSGSRKVSKMGTSSQESGSFDFSVDNPPFRIRETAMSNIRLSLEGTKVFGVSKFMTGISTLIIPKGKLASVTESGSSVEIQSVSKDTMHYGGLKSGRTSDMSIQSYAIEKTEYKIFGGSSSVGLSFLYYYNDEIYYPSPSDKNGGEVGEIDNVVYSSPIEFDSENQYGFNLLAEGDIDISIPSCEFKFRFHQTIDMDSVESEKTPLTAVYSKDFLGLMSSPNVLSANNYEVVPSVYWEFRMEVVS